MAIAGKAMDVGTPAVKAQTAPTNSVFAGANNGALTSFKVEFDKVHGLYQERYAYRELMTDVII